VEKLKDIKFSVLMSVYKNEKAEFLKEALKSIYDNQILKPNEIILVQDGPLTEELYKKIDEYVTKYSGVLRVVPLEKNVGLGNALNVGLEACSNELVARMDTDDISLPERFKVQVDYMKDNPDVDVLGSSLLEFENTPDNIIAEKKAPVRNIEDYIKFRNPMNHPTVIFRRSKVLSAGNYKEINLFEDYYLWARMFTKGYKLANIESPLLYFRTSLDTYKRRGGMKYVEAECNLQNEFLNIRLISHFEYFRNIILRNLGRLVPNFVRKELYKKILRSKGKI